MSLISSVNISNSSLFVQQNNTCLNPDFSNLVSLAPSLEGAGLCSRVMDCALAPLFQPMEVPPPPNFQLLKTDIDFYDIWKKNRQEIDESNVIEIIKNNKKVIPNGGKIFLIFEERVDRFSARTTRILLRTLKPQIQGDYIISLIDRYGKDFVLSILDPLLESYTPNFINLNDFNLLQFLFINSKKDALLGLWNKHHEYFTNPLALTSLSKGFFDKDFLGWLHANGVASSWFNFPDQADRTLLQSIAMSGDFQLMNQIIKDLPEDSIIKTSDSFFAEEMRDCFIKAKEIDLSRFDPSKIVVAQNGCRAVVMTDEGKVYSYPGQDAAKLAQQIGSGKVMESFIIYHNVGHVSIAFDDAHFGFYPTGADYPMGIDDPMLLDIKENLRLAINVIGTLGLQPGLSSSTHSFKFNTVVETPELILRSIKKNPTYSNKIKPCTVIDDTLHKWLSIQSNGLTLKVYAPKERVDAMREYAIKTRDACQAGDTSVAYNAYSNNCIDFVRKAFLASGSQADFRDAFHTMQYFRRPGIANFYTMFKSNQPIIESNSSLSSVTTIPEAIDHIPRNVVLGATASTSLSAYAYSVYKSINSAKNTFSLATSRLKLAAISMTGYGAAIGTIFMERVLRRNI